ncbi:hypothetical protein M5K25_013057 [Dendrobium thyrsiflorum]|uniref:Uncharacterized protein n=1 Tax=Dendrobium thyrsiflorum TaxID=117978 RepID=A0ABD0UZH8_DENTH
MDPSDIFDQALALCEQKFFSDSSTSANCCGGWMELALSGDIWVAFENVELTPPVEILVQHGHHRGDPEAKKEFTWASHCFFFHCRGSTRHSFLPSLCLLDLGASREVEFCSTSFFGSFIAIRLHSDGVPFLSDRKARKKFWEFARCEGNYPILSLASSAKSCKSVKLLFGFIVPMRSSLHAGANCEGIESMLDGDADPDLELDDGRDSTQEQSAEHHEQISNPNLDVLSVVVVYLLNPGFRNASELIGRHLLGHILPFGITCKENLVKECDEEAGIPRFIAENFYFADGEVDSFKLIPVGHVANIVRRTEFFKPNCSLVIMDFLFRHGPGWTGLAGPGETGLKADMFRLLQKAGSFCLLTVDPTAIF